MQNISNAAVLAESSLISTNIELRSDRLQNLDTTFVLFFLALDMGQGWLTLGLDGILAATTLAGFIALPYVLPFSNNKPAFGEWILGRTVVAAAGVTLGLMLNQSIGVLLPEAVRFVPMSLLIVAAIICCYVRIYGIMKNRLAR